MTILSKHRVVRALLRQPIDCTPVWLMRQAGRYLPEYKALRQQTPNFITFCKTPELAAQATLQPLARFDLDAAIVFSDILVIPDAMGMQVEFISGGGPVMHNPIRSLADVEALSWPDVSQELDYVMTTIKLVRAQLANRLPLIGFAGSPWTCATYMIEGQTSKTFEIAKRMLYSQPKVVHALLQRLAELTLDYLQAQIEAGAEVLMIFDTWGGILTPSDYEEFSLYYMQQIAEGLRREFEGRPKIPLVFFTKGGGNWLEQIAQSGCDAVGLDWTIDIAQAQQRVGKRVGLQGNMDPMLLFASQERIVREVQTILQSFNGSTGHVFNLGHGVLQDTPVEHVQALVEAVHRYGNKVSAVVTDE